jgi:hypothetical protein
MVTLMVPRVLHPHVGDVTSTDFGTRALHALARDGNPITFYEEVE